MLANVIKRVSASQQPRGRPRSEEARQAVLNAAIKLIEQMPYAQISIDAIAGEAGVSKATVYRWWPNKAAVLLDAFLALVAPILPFQDTGSTREDFRRQMQSFVEFLNQRVGQWLVGVLAHGEQHPPVLEIFRTRYLATRRAGARQVLQRGIARGELRADIDLEVALDEIYGPLWYRFMIGHPELDANYAGVLADQVFQGLELPKKP